MAVTKKELAGFAGFAIGRLANIISAEKPSVEVRLEKGNYTVTDIQKILENILQNASPRVLQELVDSYGEEVGYRPTITEENA